MDVLRRRGACSCVDQENGKSYVFRGYNDRRHVRDYANGDYEEYINIFDFDSEEWSQKDFSSSGSDPPLFEVGACCTIIGSKMIVFGGWDCGSLSNDVHMLDLKTLEWTLLEPSDKYDVNRPILKNKAGIAPYGKEMVFVFGGYGGGINLQKGAAYHWDSERPYGIPIGWTNEMHLFHLTNRKWIVPETTGVRPLPCAAFSLNRIDPFRVLLFAGRQRPERVNEIHILNMATWHWSGAIMPTDPQEPWPSKRSFHTACCLYNPDYVPVEENKEEIPDHFDWLPCVPPDLVTHKPMNIIKEQQLLVLWGMDNKGDPSADVLWVFHTRTMTWKQVELPVQCVPRLWHTSDCYYPTPIQCKIMTHGGVTENLLAKPDKQTTTSNKTIIMDFGMLSLFEICQKHVLRYVKRIEELNEVLPKQILLGLKNAIK